MSFGDGLSRTFLEPLEGKTAAFRLDDRPSNLKFAAAILRRLAGVRTGCRILDLDAFYASNLEKISAGVSQEGLAKLELAIPEPDSDMETVLADLFLGGDDRPLLIDSVNSLYQLLSTRNPKAASRKFNFFVSALSSWSGSNGGPALASLYDRRPATHRRGSRSLADLFDVSVSVVAKPNGLALKCEHGSAWRGGSFFLPFEDGQVEAHEHRERDQ
jgi:hypothetical protein